MGRKPFVTGKALTCSLGDSLEGIVGAVRRQQLKVEQLPFTHAGLPYTRPYYLIGRNENDRLENRSEDYFYEVLFSTVSRALADAGVSDAEIRDMPLFFGSTSMDVPVFEVKHRLQSSSVSDLFLKASDGYGKIACAVMDRFKMEGSSYCFITACTSSANAVLYAASMIEQRCIERALVVGYDLYNNLGFYGFEGLKAIASSEYRPFDRARDGLILGEACGAVVLEAQNRRDSDFTCLGGANLCDTFSVTSHDEEGAAVAQTMNRALARAGIDPGRIDAVKAHATGTENNDRTECAAMGLVFGGRIPPVTCMKPFIGHTVGACGVSELVLLTESIKAGFLPATPGFREKDEASDLAPLTQNSPIGEGIFMLNYFGFGGNCTTLILSNRGEGEMTGMYIHRFSAYAGKPDVDVQELKEEISRYARVDFRRGNRFILLSLLGACQCTRELSIGADTAIYLTTEHGNLGETAAVLDEIYEVHSLPKPYGFINTMSGTAAFYLARTLGVRGRNITVSSQHLSFERGLELLALDFAGGGESSAMIGGVDEASLSGDNAGQGNQRGWPMADSSSWFYVKPEREGACGAFTANRSFRDSAACIAWIRNRGEAAPDLLSFGALVGEDEAAALTAALRPAAGFDYLRDSGYSGSATACGVGRFMGQFQGRSLLHINRDRRGNYAVLEVERY